jgi:hypothetical protein
MLVKSFKSSEEAIQEVDSKHKQYKDELEEILEQKQEA